MGKLKFNIGDEVAILLDEGDLSKIGITDRQCVPNILKNKSFIEGRCGKDFLWVKTIGNKHSFLYRKNQIKKVDNATKN